LMKYILIIAFIIIIAVFILFFRSFQLPSKIRKAEELIEEGDFSRASSIVKTILDKKKDYVPAIYIRAKLLMRQNQYLLAISELNNILALPDFNKFIDELEVHYHLAQMYSETKNYQKEIEEYRIILTFNPDDLQANYRIGHALFRQKNYKKVTEHLSRVVALEPQRKDCYLPLGVSCFHTGEYDKAEPFLLKSLDVPGDHDEARFYLGSIYSMKKDFSNAIAMLEQARKDRRFLVKSLHLIGEMYHEQQKYDLAVEFLEQGLKFLKEKTDEAYAYRYLLAECYEAENLIKEAMHHWEKIAADNPGYRSVKMKLESYRNVLSDDHLMGMFTASMEDLQPLIVEIISSLNYNIVSKERISSNEYQYKAYNIKRINDPPLMIAFNRTTREITEGQINEFQKRIATEKCKSGIFVTTGRFSLRAKSASSSKLIDLYDAEYVSKAIEKIQMRKRMRK